MLYLLTFKLLLWINKRFFTGKAGKREKGVKGCQRTKRTQHRDKRGKSELRGVL